MSFKVFSIIVAYNPDVPILMGLCNKLIQSSRVIIVDNSPSSCLIIPTEGIRVISMGYNAGIARAQNAGICLALSHYADVIAFFDQDSSIDEDLLPSLIHALGQPPYGVVAPLCLDSRTGTEYPPYLFNRWGWASPFPIRGKKIPVHADLIISSGSVVDAGVFQAVGLMEEGFFIDYVDLEWCMRCRRAGVSIRVIPYLFMRHSIGDKVVQKGPLTIFVHSPLRSYYRLRNAFLLFRFPHVPRLYVLHEIFAAVAHHILQWQHSQDRFQHLIMGWRGLVHGVRGIRGRLETK